MHDVGINNWIGYMKTRNTWLMSFTNYIVTVCQYISDLLVGTCWTLSRHIDKYQSLLAVIILVHQQNVKQSGSHMQSSETLQSTSPLLLYTSKCYQAPLELSKVLTAAARTFTGAPGSSVLNWPVWRRLMACHPTSCQHRYASANAMCPVRA